MEPSAIVVVGTFYNVRYTVYYVVVLLPLYHKANTRAITKYTTINTAGMAWDGAHWEGLSKLLIFR